MAGVFDATRAAEFMRCRQVGSPSVAVVLGSGLAELEQMLEASAVVRMDELPGLPSTTVRGHGGRFVFGRVGSREVLLQGGRYHAYEGHPNRILTAPMRVLAALGVEVVIMTNAAGGLRSDLQRGDLVLLEDQVNFSFRAPLAGPVEGFEDRFPDMSAPYDLELQGIATGAAMSLGIPLSRGTYAGVLGPAYETRAEVGMLRELGGDVVGMSTAPEVIAARAAGLRVLGLSLVTNRATGLGEARIAHSDVLEQGAQAGARLSRLVLEILRTI